MGNDRIQVVQKSSSASGAVSYAVTGANQILSIAVNIDSLPTTSENLTITLNATAGSDHLIYAVDPSASTGSSWDLYWEPERTLALAEGDTVTVAYGNTDTNTVAVVAQTIPF